jgi:hypothetical protein
MVEPGLATIDYVHFVMHILEEQANGPGTNAPIIEFVEKHG